MDNLTYRDAVFQTSADTMEYVIKFRNTNIFRGLARKAPGEEYLLINVGEICRQYLGNQMEDFRDLENTLKSNGGAFLTFTLFSVNHTLIYTGPETWIDDVTEQAEEIYNFLFNWDYVTEEMEDSVLSDPVNGNLDCRMKLMFTQFIKGIGNTFYATPVLSAPVSGATLHAIIVTDFTDLEGLTIEIANSSITYSSLTLTGVDYIVPPNTGYTFSTTAYYYYYGRLVGTTTIISAGELGDNGEITGDTPSYETEAHYSGTVWLSGGLYQEYYFQGTYGLGYLRAKDERDLTAVYSFNISDNEWITGSTTSGMSNILEFSGLTEYYLQHDLTSGLSEGEPWPPLGTEANLTIYKNNNPLKTVKMIVNTRWPYHSYGGITANPYLFGETISVKNGRLEGRTTGGNGHSYITSWNNSGDRRFSLAWVNLIEDGVSSIAPCYAYTGVTTRQDGQWVDVYKTGIDNGLQAINYLAQNVEIMVPAGYVWFNVEDYYNGDSGITDIYIDCSLAWFNSIPNMTRDMRFQTLFVPYRIGKRFAVTNGFVGVKTIRVHCVDGDTTWVANDLVYP